MQAFLAKYWGYAGLLVLILLLFFRLDAVIAQRDLIKSERERAEAQLADMTKLLDQQNAAVDALQAAAEANRETYLAGLEAANRRAVRLEVHAEDILATPAPSDPADRCDAARDLLIGDVQ